MEVKVIVNKYSDTLKNLLSLNFPVFEHLCFNHNMGHAAWTKIKMAVLSRCFSPLHRSMTNSWMKENTPLMNGKVGFKKKFNH